MSADAFAGIEVPEGEPGALNDAAGQFGSIASSLSGVAADLRGLPASMTWSGPASVSYAGACLTNSGAVDSAVDAFGQAEHAARAYAGKLKDAKQRAREAIRDARDAQHRIDQAERDISARQDRGSRPPTPRRSPPSRSRSRSPPPPPHPGAEAAQAQAQSDGAAAADDEARARRELARAQDDLERAKKRGPRGDGRRPRRGAQRRVGLRGRLRGLTRLRRGRRARRRASGQRRRQLVEHDQRGLEDLRRGRVPGAARLLPPQERHHRPLQVVGRPGARRRLRVRQGRAAGVRLQGPQRGDLDDGRVGAEREPHVRLRARRHLGRGHADRHPHPGHGDRRRHARPRQQADEGREGDPVRRRGARDRQRRLGPVARGLERTRTSRRPTASAARPASASTSAAPRSPARRSAR